MDDIRRPHRQRRDFAMRHRAHQPYPAQPESQPPAFNPNSHPLASEQHQPINPPATHHAPEPALDQPGFAPAAAAETGYEHYGRPAPQVRPDPRTKKLRIPKVPLKYAASGLAALLLISAGVYMLSRPTKTAGFSVAQLSKKSSFGFYYPQPLPSGYSYETKINAFTAGQAYFMLVNGSKHIIFHEQTANGNSNTGGLSHTSSLQTSVGKATIGSQAGQPAAKVIAGSTLVSINTTGSVSTADLTRAINQLKTDR